MGPRCRAALDVLALCLFLFFHTGVRAESTPDSVIETVVACLHEGREIFMSRDQGAMCVPRGQGGRRAQESGMPYAIGDVRTACEDETDQRRLYGDTIKRVLQTAAQKSQAIAATGIRIIGALFCTEVDIVGVDLPYSLVLDYTASLGRIFGRNIQIRGDLSIDGSFLPRGLILTRSRINGSIYAENSYVGRVAVFDTQIQGSWHQTGSIILGSAEFRGLTLSGDLGFAETALSMLSVLSAQVAGGIVLNNGEARCAYHIRGSSFGYVFGENVGFGMMTPANAISETVADSKLILPWWSRLIQKSDRPSDTPYNNIGLRMETPAVRAALERELKAIKPAADSKVLPGCENLSHSENAEFYFLNNRVQTSLCLRSFGWLRPKDYDAQETTVLSLNGTNVGGNLIIDLWGKNAERHTETRIRHETRILEAIGVTMGALIFDFTDNARRYVTYLDGLKFNQVHTATVNCDFQRDQEGAGTSISSAPSGGILQQPSLPTVQDVMRWLDKNGSRSSQPFTAFVEAFEHAGADASDLRVARKTADLCEKTAQWLTFLRCREGPPPRTRQKEPETLKEAEVVGPVFSGGIAFASLGFQWTLYLLADHGIRPGKVVWSVIIILGIFFLLFWFALGIVGFEPKEKEKSVAQATLAGGGPWPLNVLFLFDRMLPLYKIREEHYAIGRFFRRATAAELEAAAEPPYPMRYFGKTTMVVPASEEEKKRAEKCLLFLRVIGLVLTVFLLAAINALTR